MSIFNYEKCIGCKCMKLNRKTILNNILIEDVTNEVVSYLQCRKCDTLKEYENKLSNEYPRYVRDLNKISQQIFCFQFNYKRAFMNDNRYNRLYMKNKMKELMRIKTDVDKKVLNSFVHNSEIVCILERLLTNIWSEGRSKGIVGYHMNSFLSSEYRYNGNTYSNEALMYKIVVVYVDFLIENYISYVDRTQIIKYIDGVFNPFEQDQP